MTTATLVLAVLAVGAVVMAIGLDRTKGGLKRATTSSAGLAMFGAGAGLELGNQIIMAGLTDPTAAGAAILGLLGALGTGGLLGGMNAVQFGLLAVTIIAIAIYAADGGED